MRFSDLPSRQEILDLSNEYYNDLDIFSKHIYMSHQHRSSNFKHTFSEHLSLSHAYAYLRDNPKIEVIDDFFGNNFPFIVGTHITELVPHLSRRFKKDKSFYSNHGIIVKELRAVDLLNPRILLHGYVINNESAYTTTMSKVSRKYKYCAEHNLNSIMHSLYFEGNTYQEVLDKLDVTKIMAE